MFAAILQVHHIAKYIEVFIQTFIFIITIYSLLNSYFIFVLLIDET